MPVEILIQYLATGDSLEDILAKLLARLAGITQSPSLRDPSLLLGKVGVALGEAVDRIPVLTLKELLALMSPPSGSRTPYSTFVRASILLSRASPNSRPSIA